MEHKIGQQSVNCESGLISGRKKIAKTLIGPSRGLCIHDRKLSIPPSAYDFILPVPGKPKQFFETSTLHGWFTLM
jgi:hypothetical protein